VHKVAQVDERRVVRSEFVNDAVGRVLERRRITDSGSLIERTEYLDANNQKIETDPNGVQTIHQSDPLQRLRRVSKRAAGLVAPYGASEITIEEHDYDGHGMEVRTVDANGNVTTFEYDGGDRKETAELSKKWEGLFFKPS